MKSTMVAHYKKRNGSLVDFDVFGAEVKACAVNLGLKLKQVADRIDLTPHIVYRVVEGHVPSLNTYLVLRAWLDFHNEHGPVVIRKLAGVPQIVVDPAKLGRAMYEELHRSGHWKGLSQYSRDAWGRHAMAVMKKADLIEDGTARRDLAQFWYAAEEWSLATFGEGYRDTALIKHIRKELIEIEDDPKNLEEWCDLVLLAFDGIRRAGHSYEMFVNQLHDKHEINKARTWGEPDENGTVEHVRT